MDSKTGRIQLMGTFDYEMKTSHILYMEASDRGRPSRWSTCTVIVSILPINDFEPIFKEMGAVNIPEDTAIGESVFKVEATDDDLGVDGDLSYRVGSNNDKFIVESRTGIVRLLSTLDWENEPELSVSFVASDNSETNQRSSSLVVNIAVQDRNDHWPVCEKNFYATTLSPPLQSGDIVLALNCSDADSQAYGKLYYYITSGNTNNDFSMSSDGKLVVTRKPTSAEYLLDIRIVDNGGPALETDVQVSIKVGGTPIITNLPGQITILENATIGTPVFITKATSVSQLINYAIAKVSPNGFDSDILKQMFKMDPISGQLYLWKSLDREKISSYEVVVRVTEEISGIVDHALLHVYVQDVNDNVPSFERTFHNVSIVENIEPNKSLLTVTANDLDENENSKITYAIRPGNGENVFRIDERGQILTRSAIDREIDEFFTLVITATDNGKTVRHTGTTTVLITVIDKDEYAPEFINIGSNLEINLKENTPIGVKIFAMQARDLDALTYVKYTIINDQANNHFVIDTESGDIFLASFLDRESQDVHEIVVKAESQEQVVSGTVTVTVEDINDNEPMFLANVYKFEADENAREGTWVGNLVVTDEDTGDNALIETRIMKGNIGGVFQLRKVNGSLISLYTVGKLSGMVINEYLLELEAKDKGVPALSSRASVIVQIVPEHKLPKFATDLEVIHIPENVHSGRSIFDADATLHGAIEGQGKDIVYFIVDGNTDEHFTIQREHGEITIAQRFHEIFSKISYTLQIEARNIYDPSLKDKQTLKIDIEDVNDHSPVFEKDNYELTLKEKTPIGFQIIALSATDKDRDNNAYLAYTLEQSEDATFFKIDPFTGTLSVKRVLSYSESTSYVFKAVVTDHGSPARTGTTRVQIAIIDINDNAPNFNKERTTLHVKENFEIGRIFHRVNAYDDDFGINSDIIYKVVSGNEQGTFAVDSDTGEVKLSKELDRETVDTYTFVINGEDKAIPSLTGSTTLDVVISDVNDNKPIFSQKEYSASVNRYAQLETYVLSVSAQDTDANKNALIDYQIVDGPPGIFQIDPNHGRIYTFSDLSLFENTVQLKVEARDRGFPRLSSAVDIFIEIKPPLIPERTDFEFEVSEYTNLNTFVGEISLPGTSHYSIMGGNYKESFRVSEQDGNVFVSALLDREEYSDYFLIIRAVLTANPIIQKDINVHIKITDENDNPPYFENPLVQIQVLEHTPIGFTVASFRAVDNDSGKNAALTYGIVDSEEYGAQTFFSIGENGSLIVQSTLSYESIDFLNFSIAAADSGIFPKTGTTNVQVTVVDVVISSGPGTVKESYIINFEIPVFAYIGYTLGCLKPKMFQIVGDTKNVRYITDDQDGLFDINRDTGCIKLTKFVELKEGMHFLMWVAATRMSGDNPKGSIALVRIDVFNPNQHVVIITHSVGGDVLEMNRSKSYIYVLRDKRTNSLGGIETTKHFVLQEELMHELTDSGGELSHELTTEDFDTFPVSKVEPYRENDSLAKTWPQTDAGKMVLGIGLAFIVFAILMVIVIHDIKTKKHSRKTSVLEPSSTLQVPPNSPQIDPKYNNFRRSSSAADLLPLMNALKILSNMSEKDRNKLIEQTLKSKKSDEDNRMAKATFALNKMKTVPDINVSHIDELNPIRKISNEDAEDKFRSNKAKAKKINLKHKQHARTISTQSEPLRVSHSSCVIPNKKLSAPTPISNHFKSPLPDTESLSSIELDPTETGDEIASEAEKHSITGQPYACNNALPKHVNGQIIIGGKEYDGVGKDTKTGGKYLYNTSTGEKLHVNDDVLRRAIEQRKSVVEIEPREARKSTFKRPILKRKTSRSRFSTTTIWEMNVDQDPKLPCETESENDSVFAETERDAGSARKRRVGIIDPKDKTQALTVHSRSRNNSGVSDVSEIPLSGDVASKPNSPKPLPQKKISDGSNASVGQNGTYSDDFEEDSDDQKIRRKSSANDKWDSILKTTGKASVEKDTDETIADKWSKAQKVVRFVRPIYKPLNLENVTCKVPKGKSDPKDCLSKDPVYAGWAKLVGRRMKAKVVKKRDGEARTVTVREGRSLPANLAQITKPLDVFSYTKTVSKQAPPHQNKRFSIDIRNAE
ncbi:FAT1-like protein [Mya arenaria]|uniref:FAT1-like protein n=1 Tax=Mya arenaria TaxID=6604 RepID=A0ABY7FY43_MYAAR|nr:FAT1-like protein [Mya arenaria]